MRIALTGGPKTGKTTLAPSYGLPVQHTDDTMDMPWSEASAAVSHWFVAPGPWCIEGVAVPRALRKYLAAIPDKAPCDELHVLTRPHVQLSPGQASMMKGLHTVLVDLVPALERRGVKVIYR